MQPLCGKMTGQQLEVGGGKAGQVVHQGTRILSMLFSTILTKLGYTECGPGMTRVGSKCYLVANNLHSHQEVGSSVVCIFIFLIVKLREREGQRVDLGRSLKGHF